MFCKNVSISTNIFNEEKSKHFIFTCLICFNNIKTFFNIKLFWLYHVFISFSFYIKVSLTCFILNTPANTFNIREAQIRCINIIQMNYWKYTRCSKLNWKQILIHYWFLKSQDFALNWKLFQLLSTALNFSQGRFAILMYLTAAL